MPNTVYCTGSYIAYVHAVPLTEGRLKKIQAHGFDSSPSPVSLKRGKRLPDTQGEERVGVM